MDMFFFKPSYLTTRNLSSNKPAQNSQQSLFRYINHFLIVGIHTNTMRFPNRTMQTFEELTFTLFTYLLSVNVSQTWINRGIVRRLHLV